MKFLVVLMAIFSLSANAQYHNNPTFSRCPGVLILDLVDLSEPSGQLDVAFGPGGPSQTLNGTLFKTFWSVFPNLVYYPGMYTHDAAPGGACEICYCSEHEILIECVAGPTVQCSMPASEQEGSMYFNLESR